MLQCHKYKEYEIKPNLTTLLFVKTLNKGDPFVREIIKIEVRITIPIVDGIAVDVGKNKIIMINKKN